MAAAAKNTNVVEINTSMSRIEMMRQANEARAPKAEVTSDGFMADVVGSIVPTIAKKSMKTWGGLVKFAKDVKTVHDFRMNE